MSDRINIYGYDLYTRAFNGLIKEISIYEGAPQGWTFVPPPEVPEGHCAHYFGPNWVISSGQKEIELPVPPPQVEPTVI